VSKLTKKKRLALLQRESPELIALVTDLKDRLIELREKIVPIRDMVAAEVAAHGTSGKDDLVEYLEVKQQILLTYCINVVFYLSLKCEGKSVKTHPVMRQLLELRYVMEKMRPLDSRLKHQVDRLMKLAALNPDERRGLALRPNPSALLAKDNSDNSDNSDEEDAEESSSEEETAKENAVYRPPKIAAVLYKDGSTLEEVRQEKISRKRNKLKSSELLEALREEFGDNPEAISSTGVAQATSEERKAMAAETERRDFEEERFIRMTVSKKDKNAMKRAQKNAGKLDALAGMGDVGEFEDLVDLAGLPRNKISSSANDDDDDEGGGDYDGFGFGGDDYDSDADELPKKGKKGKKGMDSSSTEAAMKRAMSAFASDGDRKRRRAPDDRMDGDNDGDAPGNFASDSDGDDGGIYDDFVDKKKAFKDAKKEHYSVAPRFGSAEAQDHDDGKKRAASYEIVKNRGLTPHRAKINRNPRVKKREQFRKATINRKGAVRDVVTGVGNQYAGETTGIKSSVSRSRKFTN